ncbi:hypothetical protein BU25DRAFT_486409 [Macroventuria anomochaeta]|uniref:Uncharacterized protein n=1 Tax=Macroventuria anomochaeta TaxID=301207 RepID=A0ACB6SIT8_9PLEO|nr:uncharacterized protein BU25DRAFT_486409 [Macroventuria anomochaeta]KAF2633264.1 hypothetical protein BU25DRAFT_486409 [Macroventuria anomochaeta]
MPKFSRFYSETEADATANISRLFPQQTDCAPQFSSDDAEQLDSILNGTTTSTSRPRNNANQPLFRPKLPVQFVEQVLNASVFSVSHETVHRDKAVRYASSSEDSVEWKIRSRSPSSEEASPRKYGISSPTLSFKAEASSTSDGSSDDGLAHVKEPTQEKQIYNWGLYPDYHAIYPQDVLQSMDTQFSKWSYDHNEGTAAIPFVMAQAPAETHERLVEVDRKLWVNGTEDAVGDSADSQDTARAMLERVQKEGLKRSSKVDGAAKVGSSRKIDSTRRDESTSKRAALIAKSKAAKESSLVVSKSVGQRRSAMQKNKNRRSIMPSPPPTARKPEPVRKPELQTEQSRPTILIVNQKEGDQRRDVDSALQNRRLDLDNRQQLEALMEQLGKRVSDKNESNEGRVIGEVREAELNGDGAEQVGRLKGKARKKAKSGAAR